MIDSAPADRGLAERASAEAAVGRLTALALRLDAAMALTKDAAVQRRIGESVAEINAVAEDLRTALLASADVGEGLRGAVTAHALAAGSRLGCTPALSFEGDLDAVPPDLAEDITAVAEEMLANVVRHSYAGSFVLSLQAGDRVVLDVRDDGVGPNEEPTAGQGISDMTARAQRHGGTYSIEPNEDAFGSRQRWDVPR